MELTKEILEEKIFEFLLSVLPQRRQNAEYYRGEQPVNKGRIVPGRPNNLLRANICRYISDVHTGYFMGLPVTFDFEGDSERNKIKEVMRSNCSDELMFSLAQNASIYGTAFCLIKVWERGIKMTALNPEKVLTVEDADGENIAALHFKNTEGHTLKGELYTNGTVQSFEYCDRRLTLGIKRVLPFGLIPIVEFKNNLERMGDFQPILSLMDAYNVLLSGAMDDMQSVAGAFLALYGMQGTTREDIDEANRSRVLSLSENGKAEFIVKNVNPAAIDSLRTTLLENMLLVTKTPNLTDETFGGNVSGVAIEYKLWGIEQSRSQKQRSFSRSFSSLLELLGFYCGFGGDISGECKISFYKNLPQDVEKICTNISQIGDVVSLKTKLELLPFVEDPVKELGRIEEEKAYETEKN